MVMDEQSYVSALYRVVLNREPDPAGLRDWIAVLRDKGDATAVLAGLLGSPEYRAATEARPAVANDAMLLALVHELKGRRLTIIDVGAQNLPYEGHVYQALCVPSIPHRIIAFEPLLDRMHDRKALENGGSIEMLPHAVGDGTQQMLHVNNEDATSSLFPLNEEFDSQFKHLSGLRTLRREPIETRRLDDVLPTNSVDFLKLDVQGAELLALRGAEQTLARTAVVHCEVEFAPIYAGQPLYPELQTFLGSCGFELIDLLISHRYSYVVPSGRDARDRLVWADAVFFREDADPNMLLAQALAALLVYRKPTLSEHLLARRDKMTNGRLADLFC